MKPIKCYCNDRVPWTIFFLSFVIFLSLLIVENSYSQNYFSKDKTNPITYLRLNEVNRKAARHFINNFLSNGNERWTRDGDFYVASYTVEGVSNRVYYDSRGAFEHNIKSYDASALNEELRNSIRKKFEGYNIKCITEINDLQKQLYFVIIENTSYVKRLKCIDGSIEVIEDFINGGI